MDIKECGMQLSRYIAHAGICSRRKAEELIASGAVSVNGAAVVEWAYKVAPKDKVEYQGRLVVPEEPVYIVLNKPSGVVASVMEEGSQTVLDLVALGKRIYPVGRLESSASGVLLMTNDGDLTKHLVHSPDCESKIERRYKVSLTRRLDRRAQNAIMDGVRLPEGLVKPEGLRPVFGKTNDWVVTFYGDQSRFMRRMFHRIGHVVKHFECVGFAGLTTEGLDRGQWRALRSDEVELIKGLLLKK